MLPRKLIDGACDPGTAGHEPARRLAPHMPHDLESENKGAHSQGTVVLDDFSKHCRKKAGLLLAIVIRVGNFRHIQLSGIRGDSSTGDKCVRPVFTAAAEFQLVLGRERRNSGTVTIGIFGRTKPMHK